MAIAMGTPRVDGLVGAVDALRDWQREGAPMQLHPGDLGWFWRFGAEATAAAVRTWSRDGHVLAVGLLDGPGLLRMTVAPDARRDEELAHRVVEDVSDPLRGVLPAGAASVEAPMDALVQEVFADAGWSAGERWTPLRRDLTEPVEDRAVRVDVIGGDEAPAWADVVRGSFDGSTFTPERWHAMAGGLPYAAGRSLLAYDDRGSAVAAGAVWSADRGRPGLLEPMGVHRDHRGGGYGRAITVAAAAALRELGSSSAMVCTPSSNAGGVATYRAAGFRQLPQLRDLCRVA